jgi:hypothetical protein
MHASAAAIDSAEAKQGVADFFTKWQTCDDSLYDDKLNVEKRFELENALYGGMLNKWIDYHKYGQTLLDTTQGPPSGIDQTLGQTIVADAMEFFWGCTNELFHIHQRLTPKYRADKK